MIYWPRASWVQHGLPKRLSTGQRSMMFNTFPSIFHCLDVFSFLDLPRRWWASTTAEVTARKFVDDKRPRHSWPRAAEDGPASISANWDARSKVSLKILGGNKGDMDNITQLISQVILQQARWFSSVNLSVSMLPNTRAAKS